MSSTSRAAAPGKIRLLTIVGALLLVLTVGGCATTAPSRYADFARAGEAHVEAFDAVAERSARSAVDIDSRLLERERSRLARDRRSELISENNELLRERVAVVRDLCRHAGLLGDYFRALASLAESDAPVVAGNAAQSLADSIQAVGSRLSAREDVATSFARVSGAVTQLVIGQIRRQSLRKELEQRGSTIARELALEEAVVLALGDQLTHERELEAQWQELDVVARPYAADGTLPEDWRERRWQVVSAGLAENEVAAAAGAIRRVRQAFQGLVHGRFGRDDARALIDELQAARRRLRPAEGTTR